MSTAILFITLFGFMAIGMPVAISLGAIFVFAALSMVGIWLIFRTGWRLRT